MLNFFDTVISYIDLLITFVVNFFKSLATMITVMIDAVTFPIELATLLPFFIASSVMAVLTISVTKLILWGSNK